MSSSHRSTTPMLFCAVLCCLAVTMTCTPTAVVIDDAGTPESGAVACAYDSDCPGDLVCGSGGLCELEQEVQTCTTTADCPLDQYCNTAMSGGTCLRLLEGSCRSDNYCRETMMCSTVDGSVGHCVECRSGSDCPSAQCQAGVCAVFTRDAGTATDLGPGNDPNCGGQGQRCCTSSSIQSTACDQSTLRCLTGFPGASDAYCWRSCTPVPCQTLEAETGVCKHRPAGRGSCEGTEAYVCSSTDQCLSAYNTGECVAIPSTGVSFCLATGCNWQANCDVGYYCSTYDNNLCLLASML